MLRDFSERTLSDGLTALRDEHGSTVTSFANISEPNRLGVVNLRSAEINKSRAGEAMDFAEVFGEAEIRS